MGTTRLSLGEFLLILLMFSACYPMTSYANDLAEARAAFDSKDYAKAGMQPRQVCLGDCI